MIYLKGFNESVDSQLTSDMVLDIIYFHNFTLLTADEKLISDIGRFINVELSDFIDFSSHDTVFLNIDEYRETQRQIDQIYKIGLKNQEIGNKLVSLYDRVKVHLGKFGFSEYEDFLIEYIDDGYEIEFLLIPNDHLSIHIKKVSDISDHMKLLSRADSTVKRIAKVLNIPISSVYIKESDFSRDGSHMESKVKIFIL